MYVRIAERQTAEVNEPKRDGQMLIISCVFSSFFFLSEEKNADSVTNVKQKYKRNICFLSSSL